jgi:hypothetical protein
MQGAFPERAAELSPPRARAARPYQTFTDPGALHFRHFSQNTQLATVTPTIARG